MTYIRVLDRYEPRFAFIGDQCEVTCEAPPGQPPCPFRLRFPLAWLRAGTVEGRPEQWWGVLRRYEDHNKEAHRV